MRRLRAFFHNRRGFSLVELMVVIAIMGVAIGVVTTSLSVVFSNDARECANDIDAMIARTKVSAMSRTGNVYMKIENGSDGIYVKYYEGSSAVPAVTERIGRSRVAITCSYTTNLATTTLPLPVCLKFSRTTSALQYVGKDAPTASSKTPNLTGDVTIACACGGKTYTVSIVPSTGSHRVS